MHVGAIFLSQLVLTFGILDQSKRFVCVGCYCNIWVHCSQDHHCTNGLTMKALLHGVASVMLLQTRHVCSLYLAQQNNYAHLLLTRQAEHVIAPSACIVEH